MKLWLIKPIDKATHWKPWYDKVFGFVIRAETEQAAREMASTKSGAEAYDVANPWLDAAVTSCAELTADGDAEIVLRDEKRA